MLSISDQVNNLWNVYNQQEKKNKYWILLYFYLLRMIKNHFKRLHNTEHSTYKHVSITYEEEKKIKKDFYKEIDKMNEEITRYIEKHLEDTFIKTWETTIKNLASKTMLPSEKDILDNINSTWVGEKNFKERQAHNTEIIKNKFKELLKNKDLSYEERLNQAEIIINQYRNMIERLVRTETIHTMGQSTIWALKLNDILEVIWIACEDEKTCKICNDRDGVIYDIDIIPTYPDHPNCRCQLLPYMRNEITLGGKQKL